MPTRVDTLLTIQVPSRGCYKPLFLSSSRCSARSRTHLEVAICEVTIEMAVLFFFTSCSCEVSDRCLSASEVNSISHFISAQQKPFRRMMMST